MGVEGDRIRSDLYVYHFQQAIATTNTCLYCRMGHGIRDQLLQLVDEVEKLTTEVFEAVQEGNQAENLLELLMKKVVYIFCCLLANKVFV